MVKQKEIKQKFNRLPEATNFALIIHNHNFIMNLNKFFANNSKATINKQEFMEMQLIQWREVKKQLGIKIDK